MTNDKETILDDETIVPMGQLTVSSRPELSIEQIQFFVEHGVLTTTETRTCLQKLGVIPPIVNKSFAQKVQEQLKTPGGNLAVC